MRQEKTLYKSSMIVVPILYLEISEENLRKKMAHESLAPVVRGAILDRVDRGFCCVQKDAFLFHLEPRFSSIDILVPDTLLQAKSFCCTTTLGPVKSPENQPITWQYLSAAVIFRVFSATE